mmetsp:Transcript_10106/g.21616  ORF Transcript_10106/g.21616 Transcript_10106/m.21616 type:complete len:171 (-) Transcript_10106:807-1319(-)|eukprot:CAMPEP_0202892476 /NCGR_PEP_ID=MMETSP1392-20130828/2196_1 /ASSEMBLY_ACC=CAM_ASM_000868 /TAXON_ID=225041 /ORGANISM="Chlamydomonas chlamydogama, Strain SAG 11-48b" /LENGTH=170 /DNA_ID=CAMNT_0049576439 /DNA_START=139 /DNA_END=651 /DNA_ORIENTATION=+
MAALCNLNTSVPSASGRSLDRHAHSQRGVSITRAHLAKRPVVVAASLAALERSYAPHSPVTVDRGYAVIDVGGTRQYVEEGTSFACSKQDLGEASLGSVVQFQKVLALKQDGELYQGKPYLNNVVVEGRLEDEFRGPVATPASAQLDGGLQAAQLMLSKVLITRIYSPAC